MHLEAHEGLAAVRQLEQLLCLAALSQALLTHQGI